MGKTTVVLSLPEEVVEQFRQFAAAGSRTLEDVMAETLETYQPTLAEYEKMLAPLADYSDERLWQVVNETLTQAEIDRYQALSDKRSTGTLLEDEQREIHRLVEKIEIQMLFRSEAVAILKERGHDVSRFIGQTAHGSHF
jgi:hypothetical protein